MTSEDIKHQLIIIIEAESLLMSPKPFTVPLFCLQHVFVQTKSDSEAGTETPTGGAWGGEEGDYTYR